MSLIRELAAARFALLSPDQVLERLDYRFRFLVSGAAGRDQRHRTLIALLEWGFALLSPDEQRLLTWLSHRNQGFRNKRSRQIRVVQRRAPNLCPKLNLTCNRAMLG